jgi:hypothetical protein
MRVRHKIPNVFSLSMIDVLCCALGCVILLWLLGAKQSDDENADLRDKAKSELAAERDRADEANKGLLGRLGESERNARAMRRALARGDQAREDAEKDRRAWKDRYGDAEKDRRAWQARYDDAEKDRTAWKNKYGDAEKDRDEWKARFDSEKKDKTAWKNKYGDAVKDKSDWKTKYDEAEKDRRAWKDRYGDAEKDRTAWKTKYDDAEKDKTAWKNKYGDAEKDRSAWKGRYDSAEKDKTAWKGKYEAALKDSERRFAGITLTGERVVFLVDKSGSMVLLDRKTDAPQKWAEVCGTVGKLMESLPDLKKYQVICFSTKLEYPLGGEGKWLDFDPKKTPKEVVAKLKQVKVDGGTDIHLGMKAAFDLRKQGLDAVYLLSDGLPSSGEGVSAKERDELSEAELGQRLGNYIRKKLKAEWNRPDEKKQKVKVNTIGFFYESPDLGAFLWALARENDGSFVGMSKP